MKRKQIHIVTWAGALFAGAVVLFNAPPSTHSFYPRCPFYAATHLLCPGCGGTRALYEMLHLNLSGAMHYNALVTALLPLVLAWLAWSCYQAFRYDQFPSIPWPRTFAVSFAVVAILFAVIRDTGIAFAI
jgi:hypothetical protein